MDEKQGEFRQDYGQSQRSERGTIEDHRHLHQSSSQSCLVKATNGFVSGTVLGATMSGLTGMARATQMQIRFPAAVPAVIGATIVGGLSFGVALGTYQAAVCTIRQVRGDSHSPILQARFNLVTTLLPVFFSSWDSNALRARAGVDDIKNPMLAGALVGAMSEIPVFLRSMVVTKTDVLLAEQGMHAMRPRPRFLRNAVGGAVVCGLFYTMGDAMRPAPLPKPQGSPQPPQAPTRHPFEGEELATSNALESQENHDTGEWVITDPPSGEVLESEDLRWGSK